MESLKIFVVEDSLLWKFECGWFMMENIKKGVKMMISGLGIINILSFTKNSNF